MQEGADNDLLTRIAADKSFAAVHDRVRLLALASRLPLTSMSSLDRVIACLLLCHAQLKSLTDPAKFVGRAPEQVTEFIEEELDPVLAQYAAELKAADAAVAAVKV